MSLPLSAARTTKAPEAFRTISEVAGDLDVPQHVLRFWESRFAQVHPLKRAGGRRYYRPEEVALLRGIRSLLYHHGYTIKGVQKILRERGVAHVIEAGQNAPTSSVRRSSPLLDSPDEPRFARAVIARVQNAHEDVSGDRIRELDIAVQRKLDSLLDELVSMKAQLRSARGDSTFL